MEAARLADPVAPARRSAAALTKVHTRTLADGTPAMSFTRHIVHLATIVRNTLKPRSARPGEATFTPTPKQQQALDLFAGKPCEQSRPPRFMPNRLKRKPDHNRLPRNFGLNTQLHLLARNANPQCCPDPGSTRALLNRRHLPNPPASRSLLATGAP
jgi:hypothetical protein